MGIGEQPCEQLSDWLEAIGYSVTSAANRLESLGLLPTRDWSLVIVNSESLAKEGREMLRELRERKPQTPVLVCSSKEVKTPGEMLARISGFLNDSPSPQRGEEAIAGGGATLRAIEREHIRAVLKKNGWQIKKSAEELGIDRSTLYAKIEKYGLRRPG